MFLKIFYWRYFNNKNKHNLFLSSNHVEIIFFDFKYNINSLLYVIRVLAIAPRDQADKLK